MPNRRKCWNFDGDAYVNDLKQEMKKEMTEASKELLSMVKASLLKINFKGNPVKLLKSSGKAGEITKDDIELTSDALRKADVLEALIRDRVSWEGSKILKTKIKYTTRNFEKSHIGIYYEHGIGSKWDGITEAVATKNISVGSMGKPLSSRSKFINYVGQGLGVWIDLGGNKRITKSIKAGETTLKFRKYVGKETPAYHWFGKAFKSYRSTLRKKYRSAFKRVKITNKKYWSFMSTFTLGVD
jgi:hypothetical protein